ncbi:sigma-70 family RNA polymerase sigma factor [Patescibacteria group bacterium]|nr:sigma-70 family RNA polymerase sigma factor [Patescibacteria group bacterium]
MEIRYSTTFGETTQDFGIVFDEKGVAHASIAMPDNQVDRAGEVEQIEAKSNSQTLRPLEVIKYKKSDRCKLPSQVGDLISAYLELEEIYQDFKDELGQPLDIAKRLDYDPTRNPHYPIIERVSEDVSRKQWLKFDQLKQAAPYKPMSSRITGSTWRRPQEVSANELARDEMRNLIAMQHVGLVFEIANERFSYIFGSDRKDMIQEAGIGLLVAVENFDPNSKYRFSSYAWKCIYGTMLRFTKSRSLVHIPDNVQDSARRARSIMEDETMNNHQKNDQLGAGAATSLCGVPELLDLAGRAEVSLLGNNDQELLGRELSPEELVSREIARRGLEKMLAEALTPTEKYVLLRRNGLDRPDRGDYDLSLEAISRDHNVSRECVRQIEMDAIRKIRNYIRKNKISVNMILSA